MGDDLSQRRTARTMRGVVCAITGKGSLTQGDLDEIARFKRFLAASRHLPAPGQPITPEQAIERLRIYHESYQEDGSIPSTGDPK